MINPFLNTERLLPVAVERRDFLPRRLLAWRRPRPAPAATSPGQVPHGPAGQPGAPRPGGFLLRRIPR